MFILAEEFLRASQMLIDTQRTPGFDINFVVPRPNVMVHAMSFEILLKCLFVLDFAKIPTRTHNLKRLFESLAPETQQRMRDHFDPTVGQRVLDHYRRRMGARIPLGLPSVFSFDFALAASSGAFDHVRFAYEREARPTEQWQGEPLVQASRKVILERHPMWETAPKIGSVVPTFHVPPITRTR
jgi:hypothetical protein